MSKFDRKVNRNKDTKINVKPKPEVKVTLFQEIKEVISFSWFNFSIKNTIITFLIFCLSTLLIIPVLLRFMSIQLAMLLGHGLFTSAFLAIGFSYTNKVEIRKSILIFLYISFLLSTFSLISLWVM